MDREDGTGFSNDNRHSIEQVLDLLYGLGRVGDVTREMIFYEELDLQRNAPLKVVFVLLKRTVVEHCEQKKYILGV